MFVINSNNLKYLNDIKSDLTGIFKRCLQAKCKIFDINDKYVKTISSNKNNKLEEGQFFIHLNQKKTFMGSCEISFILKTKIKRQLIQK